jgi:large subunit ribosomal protein L35Ae
MNINLLNQFFLALPVSLSYTLGAEAGRGVKFTKTRVVWGRITKSHGLGGVVRARFQRNLTPAAMGNKARVMLYPSRI